MYEEFTNNTSVDYSTSIPESNPLDSVAEMERISHGAAPNATSSCVEAVGDYSAPEKIERNRIDNISDLGEEYVSDTLLYERMDQQSDVMTSSPLMVGKSSEKYSVPEIMDIANSNAFELGKLLWDRSQAGVQTPSHLAIPEENPLRHLTQKELKHIYHTLKRDADAVKIHTGKGWIENYGKDKLHKDLGCFSVEGEVNGAHMTIRSTIMICNLSFILGNMMVWILLLSKLVTMTIMNTIMYPIFSFIEATMC